MSTLKPRQKRKGACVFLNIHTACSTLCDDYCYYEEQHPEWLPVCFITARSVSFFNVFICLNIRALQRASEREREKEAALHVTQLHLHERDLMHAQLANAITRRAARNMHFDLCSAVTSFVLRQTKTCQVDHLSVALFQLVNCFFVVNLALVWCIEVKLLFFGTICGGLD
jgi:hypothetical protein